MEIVASVLGNNLTAALVIGGIFSAPLGLIILFSKYKSRE